MAAKKKSTVKKKSTAKKPMKVAVAGNGFKIRKKKTSTKKA
jgi:hypothetical protein